MSWFQEDKEQTADPRKGIDKFEQMERSRAEKEGRPRAQRRAEARAKLLPTDRRCPECQQIVVNSRSWVVKDGVVICRSCYYTELGKALNGEA